MNSTNPYEPSSAEPDASAAEQADADRNRDAATLQLLGLFFLVLGILVAFATIWAMGNTRAMIVNLGSGILIAGIGLIMRNLASRLLRAR